MAGCTAVASLVTACSSIPTERIVASNADARRLVSACPAPPPGKILIQMNQDFIDRVHARLQAVRHRLLTEQHAFDAVMQLILTAIESRIFKNPNVQLSSISSDDVEAVATNLKEAVVKSRTEPAAARTVPDDFPMFEDAVGFYFIELFQGKYVDRLATS
jgi:hypothetical protein